MGCKVWVFMSDNYIEPDMTAEMFVLEAGPHQQAEPEASDSST